MRKELVEFSNKMETVLKRNDYKTHWNLTSINYLYQKIRQEFDELGIDFLRYQFYKSENLSNEIICSSLASFAKQCTDIANYAMMINDNAMKETENILNKKNMKDIIKEMKEEKKL